MKARRSSRCVCGLTIQAGQAIYPAPGAGWVCAACARARGVDTTPRARGYEVHQKSQKPSEWRLRAKRRP